MSKTKKEKKGMSYVDAHNKAVKTYKRSSLFILWGGIINIFGAIMGVFNFGKSEISEFGINYRYSLSLASNRFIFNSLEYSEINVILSSFIVILVAIATAALLAIIGYLANKGNIKYLMIGMGIYIGDFIFTFIYDNLLLGSLGAFELGFNWTIYAFSIAIHSIILIFIVIAIINYYQVLNIEKKHQEELAKQGI